VVGAVLPGDDVAGMEVTVVGLVRGGGDAIGAVAVTSVVDGGADVPAIGPVGGSAVDDGWIGEVGVDSVAVAQAGTKTAATVVAPNRARRRQGAGIRLGVRSTGLRCV
jgi:hypothetical protein